MVLIHDLVEIDAGDTYAYDAVGGATQHTREAAAQRIYGILPEDQENGFMILGRVQACETPEAKYAHMLTTVSLFFEQCYRWNQLGRAWREEKSDLHETAVLVREHQKSGNICRN